MKRTLLVSFAIMFGFVSFCYALETNTHEEMNEYIARNTLNGFLLDSYLRYQLGIQEGIEESYDSKTPWQWLREGGKYEDKPPENIIPYRRSVNHFHNPLTDRGLSGRWGFLSFDSSIEWLQKPIETQSPGGYYSWHDVRNYFYKALTSESKTDRDKNFSETFRGLGQLMHLVQDLSVPEHTRDDGHIIPAYESWVDMAEHVNISPGAGLIYIKDTEITPELMVFFHSAFLGNSNPLASVPVANLFDTNRYNGTNPDITPQSNIGLSEYTNANFFSPDTIFSDDFPYPSKARVEINDYDIEDPRDPSGMVLREYYTNVIYGDSGYRLATVSVLADYATDVPAVYAPASLDNEVYGDYAERLIPRAVGYSAGLLNYFFRGKLNAFWTEEGLVVENVSQDRLHDGVFKVYYDNSQGERISIAEADVGDPLPERKQTIEVDLPAHIGQDGYFMLVYRGGLGDEADAVIGKEFGTSRFTDNENGTVTDNSTGLIWLKSSGCDKLPYTNDGYANWTMAKAAAGALSNGTCGLSDGSEAGDWRLPSNTEWEEFFSDDYVNPALENTKGNGQCSQGDPFFGADGRFNWSAWSSTEYDSEYAYIANVYYGHTETMYDKLEQFYVWPVRGGTGGPDPDPDPSPDPDPDPEPEPEPEPGEDTRPSLYLKLGEVYITKDANTVPGFSYPGGAWYMREISLSGSIMWGKSYYFIMFTMPGHIGYDQYFIDINNFGYYDLKTQNNSMIIGDGLHGQYCRMLNTGDLVTALNSNYKNLHLEFSLPAVIVKFRSDITDSYNTYIHR